MRAKLTAAIRVLGRWSLAHIAIRVEEYLFDYLLYPFMLYRGGDWLLGALLRLAGVAAPPSPAVGYWFGFCLLTAASIGINLLYIRAYDGLRTDWFGFEALKAATERYVSARPGWRPWRAVVRYAAFVYLSVWHSPLFGALFMRGETNAYAMTARDWRIFWVALLVANLGWAGLVSGVVEVVSALLPHVT